MSESNNCCEKCDAEMWDGPKGKCYNDTCPCHSTTPDTDKAKIALILTPLIKQIFHGENHTNEQIHKELDNAIEKLTTLLTSRDTYWKEQLQKARETWLEEMEQEVADLRAEHANIARHGNDPDSAYDRVEGMLWKKKQDQPELHQGINK